VRISREDIGEDLECDDAFQPRVAGFVDLAHAAGTECGEYFVWTETKAGCEGDRRLPTSCSILDRPHPTGKRCLWEAKTERAS
jgi:hypothetical protein